MNIKAICLTAHPTKEVPTNLMAEIVRQFQGFGVKVFIDIEISRHFAMEVDVISLSDTACCDAIIVVGGDGTLLHVVPYAVKNDVPVLAINAGRIGFLTEVEQNQLEASIAAFCKGNFTVEERMLLEATYNQGQKVLALNDIVVSRGNYSRLIMIDAFISNDLVGKYVADGVIISSPTGSTGYSLSAGGPIVSPQLDCMIITPICAHSLQQRPVVLGANEDIRLEIDCELDAGIHLVADGHEPIILQHNKKILVSKAIATVKLIRLQPLAFFSLVRKKLMEWSQ